jgi:hypothetical protein
VTVLKKHLLIAMSLVFAQLSLAETRVNFDDFAPGSLPSDWLSGVTGKGTANWQVVKEDSAPSPPNALKQSGEATFVWVVKTDAKFSDGFIETKFKPVSGSEDQAGGIVWRFQDGNNYYVVRANALEDNVVLYKTVNGKRSPLPVKGRMFGYGVDIKVPKNQWSTLRVGFAGALFTVWFNGPKLFEVEDGTFKDEGSVGLWTKADSVTFFDDFVFGGKQ